MCSRSGSWLDSSSCVSSHGLPSLCVCSESTFPLFNEAPEFQLDYSCKTCVLKGYT